jgi:type IV pilus assembly protein PilO
MPRNFDTGWKTWLRDPRHAVRLVLGVLLAANLAAAWFAFHTPGGTVEDLERELASKRLQLAARRQAVERLQAQVAKTEAARQSSETFLREYFLPRQHAYSLLEIELANAARRSGVRARERNISYEPIEGSDTLGVLNINANFEGTYADLIEFLYALDRSRRMLILEQLQASPQQSGAVLAMTLKLNAFIRMEGPQEADEPELLTAAPASAPAVAAPPAPVKPAASQTPAAAVPVSRPQPAEISEPRSGPMPQPPKNRFFNRRRPAGGEEEQ